MMQYWSTPYDVILDEFMRWNEVQEAPEVMFWPSLMWVWVRIAALGRTFGTAKKVGTLRWLLCQLLCKYTVK